MRTTLTIDDDILAAARDLADSQRKSVGEIISSLARKALSPREPEEKTRNGFPLLRKRRTGLLVTSDIVRRLDEETP